ncbi:hypothetical protein [Aeromicrobium wangtongii]|uniref:DUF5753 domain-containing protein n=1 Tax=Aeromicrobium wangtongii TaxID=2969247 RepID=A0ABY5M5M7_9ACTN|nr:hypothetical protein [Aeromicrobium wangtongii]MCD9198030.1 hypothetical protein [Aeromicrobium wangtongii]UUP12072.1 hypothetical protein NQV15_09380 [Aeromicrobium wangtongii]
MPDDISLGKILLIVRRLAALTQTRQIAWKETGQNDVFVHPAASASVVVGSRDGDGDLPMFVRILDEDGDLVDELSTENTEHAEWFDELRRLHVLAKRSATDADRVLDALLAELPDVQP